MLSVTRLPFWDFCVHGFIDKTIVMMTIGIILVLVDLAFVLSDQICLPESLSRVFFFYVSLRSLSAWDLPPKKNEY